MKKAFFICLLFPFFLSVRAAMLPLPRRFFFHQPAIPVSYNVTSKAVVLYIPSSCSGMVNDAVAGEGEIAVSVLGKIQNGQLSVKIKVDCKGSAVTTVEGLFYQVNGKMAAFETMNMEAEPVDVFIKGVFKLEGTNKTPPLFIDDIGYITIYPDGTVANHIFDPKNDPEYSRPKVYCTEPKG